MTFPISVTCRESFNRPEARSSLNELGVVDYLQLQAVLTVSRFSG